MSKVHLDLTEAKLTDDVKRQRLIYECYRLAYESDCLKAKFGSVVVLDWKVIGYGWNHVPNPDYCCEKDCVGSLRKDVPSSTRVKSCYAVHAEQAALLMAGSLARGADIYVAGYGSDGRPLIKDTSLPIDHPNRGVYCTVCARLIWEARCKNIFMESTEGLISYNPKDIWKDSYAVAGKSI